MSTNEEILQQIRRRQVELDQETREVVHAESSDFCQEARELLKYKSIKVKNNISRDHSHAETDGLASPSFGEESGDTPNSEEVINSQPASTNTRAFTGISVQHCRTERGVKLAINLQTQEWAQSGEILALTAELKRWNRLREVKPYKHDSPEFTEYFVQTRRDLKDLDPADRKPFCFGRLHERGRRTTWIANALAVATIAGNQIQEVILNIEGEEYIIPMTRQMTTLQSTLYHSSGEIGTVRTQSQAPTVWTVKRKQI